MASNPMKKKLIDEARNLSPLLEGNISYHPWYPLYTDIVFIFRLGSITLCWKTRRFPASAHNHTSSGLAVRKHQSGNHLAVSNLNSMTLFTQNMKKPTNANVLVF